MIRLKNLFKHQLVLNSAVFSFANVLVGGLGYLFHIVVARLLSIEIFGEFESLLSVFALVSVPLSAVTLVTTKFISTYSVAEGFSAVKCFMKKFEKSLFIGGVLIFFGFFIFRLYIVEFLNISSVYSVLLIGAIFVFLPVVTMLRGILQGLSRFFSLSLNVSLDALLKLLLGLVVLLLGFSLNFIFLAMFFTTVFSYLFLKFQLRKISSNKNIACEIDIAPILKYSIPTVYVLVCLNFMYTFDLIMVKHFFAASDVGLYGGVAIIARIVFYVTGAISVVMFPEVSKLYESGKNHYRVLYLSMLMTALISGVSAILFFMEPYFFIKLLLGEKFIAASQLLGWYSVAMFFMALSNLIVKYFLSLSKIKYLSFIGAMPLLVVGLIYFYHSSLLEVIIVLTLVLALMFLLLCGFLVFDFLKGSKRLLS